MLVAAAACARSDQPAATKTPSSETLTIGYGLITGRQADAGIREAARNIAVEGLLTFSNDGRPQARLAEKWSTSADGRVLRIQLRAGVRFHDGQPVTALTVRESLVRDLRELMGPAHDDVEDIRATGEYEIEFSLKEPSAFVLEGLEIRIQRPGTLPVGTGPFIVLEATDDQTEMRANPDYYAGKPSIGRIVFRPYASTRSAWADLLRGRVDMVYEVGTDALDLLQPSSTTKVFTFERPYTYTIILNVKKPFLRDVSFRRTLNAAIDRQALITEGLRGHGFPADGPVSRHHWAYDATAPRFEYRPEPVATRTRPRFKCLISEPSHERLALILRKQLEQVGIDVEFEEVSIDQVVARITSGEFDALLAEVLSGPTLLRPYWFWHSDGPFNWGHYSSPPVDAALDSIRHAINDAAYKAGVAAYQRAIVADPPAIFLAWGERARAVSTRFEVPAGGGGDILGSGSLRLWRPVQDEGPAGRN